MSASLTNQYSTEGLKESQIQNLIISYLNMRGIYCWKNNTGMVHAEYKGKKRMWKAGLKGSADIIGILTGTGRFMALEVKTAKGKITPAQDAFLDEIAGRGGVAGVVRSIEDVDKLLEL